MDYKDSRAIANAKVGGKEFRIINNSTIEIEKWRIDDCIFKNETGCDYLFLVNSESKKSAFWVELKGSDVNHAAYQILTTLKKVDRNWSDAIPKAKIIPSKNPNPNLRGSSYNELKRFLAAKGGDIKNKNILLEETI